MRSTVWCGTAFATYGTHIMRQSSQRGSRIKPRRRPQRTVHVPFASAHAAVQLCPGFPATATVDAGSAASGGGVGEGKATTPKQWWFQLR